MPGTGIVRFGALSVQKTETPTKQASKKPDPEEKLVRSPERRKGGYAVSPEVLQAAMEGRIKTVRAGRKNFFTMY